MRSLATFAAIAALSVPFAFSAQAQDAPKSCGGLLCDMGLFGGRGSASTSLPCNDFLCRALGGRQAEAAPPPPPVADAPMPVEPAPMKRSKKKHVAKADVPSDAMAPAAAPK